MQAGLDFVFLVVLTSAYCCRPETASRSVLLKPSFLPSCLHFHSSLWPFQLFWGLDFSSFQVYLFVSRSHCIGTDSMMGAWQPCCRPIRDLAFLLPHLPGCSAPTPVCKCGLLTLVPETTKTERTWGPNVCQGRTHCQALSHNSRTRRLTIKIWNKQLHDKVNTVFGVLIFLGA